MSFSGFVLTERACYSAAHFLTYSFSTFFIYKSSNLEQFLELLDIFEQGNLDLESLIDYIYLTKIKSIKKLIGAY